MDATDAGRMESLLALNPDDVEARTKLLGYYMQRSYLDTDARRRKTAHCLWMIRHRPEDEIVGTPFGQVERFLNAAGYRKAKALWRKQVERRPGETAILSNAAKFHTGEDKRTAIALYKRLQRIEPRNPEWHERLGHVYQLDLVGLPGRKRSKSSATRALAEWKAALALSRTDSERFYLLTTMAPVAVDAGRLREASRLAGDLVKLARRFRQNWNHGNAVHYAQSTLGRIALRTNRLSEAKRHLIASARTKGSPQLNSFGPNQDLAAELLARGETKAVLRYLELCRKFWAMGHQQIEAWTRNIQESGKTNFMPVFDMPAASKKGPSRPLP